MSLTPAVSGLLNPVTVPAIAPLCYLKTTVPTAKYSTRSVNVTAKMRVKMVEVETMLIALVSVLRGAATLALLVAIVHATAPRWTPVPFALMVRG